MSHGGRTLRIGAALLGALLVARSAQAWGWEYASLWLLLGGEQMSNTTHEVWSLEKTGSYDATSGSVSWSIQATPGVDVAGQIEISGTLVAFNAGRAPAPIGSILVNLQTRSGSGWVSRSVDIADATSGDAATSARIVPSASSEGRAWFSEDAASGSLSFRNAGTGEPVSLSPQLVIAPGAWVVLELAATFDNEVLGLAEGTLARAEGIVTFGNAAPVWWNGQDVDIDGDGVIEAEEAWVRSVPRRKLLAVPGEVPGDSTVVLGDTVDDITTTGTVTFSNPVFSLGETSGSVTVEVEGGAEGGTITNCAHLTGTSGLSLEACNSVAVPGSTCIPGTVACGWHDGDVITYGQAMWGLPPGPGTPAELLLTRWSAVYAATFGVLEVGIPGASGFSISFLDGLAASNYLPAAGPPAPLNGDHLNPGSTASGVFGGEVTTLAINIDFSDAGVIAGTSGLAFGDLTLCGSDLPLLDGLTMRQLLAEANVVLGGGAGSYTAAELYWLLDDVDRSFSGGLATAFAQDHIFNGPCP